MCWCFKILVTRNVRIACPHSGCEDTTPIISHMSVTGMGMWNVMDCWPRCLIGCHLNVQLRIGDVTESLSVRVWLNNKSILLHNIYRVDGEFDVVTPLSDSEESIMAADFNARHTSWCRNNNAAGSSLNDQLVQLDTHILMNTPHLSTTVHDTGIDLSLVSNEMAAKTYWSIYPGLVSDHLAVKLTVVAIGQCLQVTVINIL